MINLQRQHPIPSPNKQTQISSWGRIDEELNLLFCDIMSAYQPFQDPDGGKSTGAPPTPPVTNNFYGANANAWQGVNFNDQSAQISGYQSRYTYRGQPGNTSYGSPAASQADYQPGDDAYRPPPQGYGPTAQSSRHSYPEATQDYYPAAQALVTEGYSPPTDQDQYTGYPALASDATAQDSVVALTETQTSSSEYEWVRNRSKTSNWLTYGAASNGPHRNGANMGWVYRYT
jgi:hypothetical protein